MIARNIPALNGLRGLAALIVVVSHFSNETGLFGGILGWGAGQTGVMLFFILAGFLMTHLHANEEFSRSNVASYALKRLARVYPFFVIVAALPGLMILLNFPGKVAMGDINSIPIYLKQVLLLEKGSNVFWTIQIEILFYACFLVIWGIHRLIRNALISLPLVIVTIFYLGLHGFVFSTPFFGFVHYFLIGVASALAVEVFGAKTYRSWTTSCLGIALLISLPFTYPKVFLLISGASIDPWTSILVLVQITILFNFVLRDNRYLKLALTTRPIVWLGKVSYSVYLLHYFILDALISWSNPSEHYFSSFIIFISLVCIIAALSFHFIERPIQQFTLRCPELLTRCIRAPSTPNSMGTDTLPPKQDRLP